VSEVFSSLGVVGEVLAIWSLISLVAVVPLLSWFRLQAVANELRFRHGRRQAWLAESRPADLG
jgi:hypothetical protein